MTSFKCDEYHDHVSCFCHAIRMRSYSGNSSVAMISKLCMCTCPWIRRYNARSDSGTGCVRVGIVRRKKSSRKNVDRERRAWRKEFFPVFLFARSHHCNYGLFRRNHTTRPNKIFHCIMYVDFWYAAVLPDAKRVLHPSLSTSTCPVRPGLTLTTRMIQKAVPKIIIAILKYLKITAYSFRLKTACGYSRVFFRVAVCLTENECNWRQLIVESFRRRGPL